MEEVGVLRNRRLIPSADRFAVSTSLRDRESHPRRTVFVVGRAAPRPPSRTLMKNIADVSLVIRFPGYQATVCHLVSAVAERTALPQKISLSPKKWRYISVR
jgi:hypothetical protein